MVQRSRLRADRFADQFHLRGHQAAARGFRDACAKQGVIVGRDFPPYEKKHCRISIATMAEMQRAVTTFAQALAQPAQAA